MHEKMDRHGPRPNWTENGIEYLISLNILWSRDIFTSGPKLWVVHYAGSLPSWVIL